MHTLLDSLLLSAAILSIISYDTSPISPRLQRARRQIGRNARYDIALTEREKTYVRPAGHRIPGYQINARLILRIKHVVRI